MTTENIAMQMKFEMKDEENKVLCLSLMKADSTEEVISILQDAGYWDNPNIWRPYGDNENNYSTAGAQQNNAEAALVEKLVNAVDARLMNECLVRGILPSSSAAPKTIQQAVARFFEEDSPKRDTAGVIREWDASKRTAVARGITLTATGSRSSPSFTISDCGEGQTPLMIPETLVSLNKSNKLRIPFVQGKFNMGGTGVLRFCGKQGLQLIVSRRNPDFPDNEVESSSDQHWGFTIVRRENPAGGRRSSVYTYLAPIGSNQTPGKGKVLRFLSESMPIFPEGREPYARASRHGTLIKLYEYGTRYKTNMLLDSGIMRRLDLRLADVALPIRLYECRDYRGHSGSFENTMTGVKVRLEDDKAKNLEIGFPSSFALNVLGEQMTATIYAFKRGKANIYRRNEGIIFLLNGQTHAHFPSDFFARKKVGLGYLRDSILVIVDCSRLTGRSREDLFMNSRDRLSDIELRNDIERELEDLLKRHDGLRELREKRRREELKSRIDDSKPLENVLESLLQHSPTLSQLFLQGTRISTPFKTHKVQSSGELYVGKQYPTYFRFKDKEYGRELHSNCQINLRRRVAFETDAANDYFSRDINPGTFSLMIATGSNENPVEDYSINLQNGIATLSVQLPANCRVGDQLRFKAIVNDETHIEPFINSFVVTVLPASSKTRSKSKRRKPPSTKPGTDREYPSGITLPNVVPVYESQWEEQEPPFNQYTALRTKHAGSSDDDNGTGGGKDVYDFFINMDNAYLNTELKNNSIDPDITKARFQYGMVLLGLGLLHGGIQDELRQATDSSDDFENGKERDVAEDVERFSAAVAPILLPMLDTLGSLHEDDE